MNTNDHPARLHSPSPADATSPVTADDAASSPTARRPHPLWRLPAYRRWFAADTADVVAVSLRTFAIPLLGLALSGSPFVAGLLVTIESAIGLTLMSVGGALADRHDRRRLMILLGLTGTVLSAAVTVMLATGTMRATTFAVAVVLFAVMNGLLGPSNDAMLKSLVPMDRFAKAQAIREARESCVELSGGAIGGLLYRIAGWMPFLASALLYLTSVFASLALPKRNGDGTDKDDSPSSPDVGKPSFLSQFVEGWRWTLTRRTVLAAIAQGAVMNVACYGSIIGVQIMLAERGTDAALIGLVGTATGVAALIGSLAAGWLVEHVPTGRLIILTFAVFTAAMLPLVFTDSYAAAVTCMAMASVLFPALNAGELGFIFGRTPDDMQGRVSTVFETTVGVPGALAPALVGWLLQTPGFGFRAVMLLVVLCAAAGLLLACLTPTRRIPLPPQWEQVEL
ncbi:MFS transporter [Bifidobacterium stellenboschense]|uniref:Major facilitator superfamily protein n=1 Tax=Bifidobacterium stellenboschense TaxID=762211 RepID=A0A087DPJ7_9BIFI|nr:MFS transporter [Bifidobacterium stellenboschense]KFI97447.1 major facilitator superfamily protein [Bifidobacterium stellenboschense]